MLALVVAVCLKADPANCGDHVVAWMPYEDAASCTLNSRPRMAAWARQNPDVTVQGFTCMPGRGASAPRDQMVLTVRHQTG